jgi:hypothetical protein
MAFGTHLPFPLPRPFTLADTGLSGTSAGVATVTGTLTNEAGGPVFVGQSDGVAAVTGTLLLIKDLSGSSDGVATVSGSLFVGPALIATSDGIATVSGTLSVIADLSGSSAGTATVTGDLAYRYLYGTPAGTATVSGDLFSGIPGLDAGFEIPYPFLGGGRSFDLLTSSSLRGQAAVSGTLSISVLPVTSTAGIATVSGTLFTEAGPAWMSASSTGQATVSAWLLNRVDANIVELAGTSAGTSTVIGTGFLTIEFPDPVLSSRFLYQYVNVGVGFDPIDDTSGRSDYTSQTFPDGDAIDGKRFLYEYVNVGVGFNDTDSASGRSDFTSQTFPDGNIWEDFDRYLYQLVNVLNLEPSTYPTVVINEGYAGNNQMVNDPAAPGQKL